jgi:predicted DNA-binding transcriptional regulator AlpA
MDTRFITTATVAKLFNLSTPTVIRYGEQGLLPKPVRFGSTRRWPEAAILSILQDPGRLNRGGD